MRRVFLDDFRRVVDIDDLTPIMCPFQYRGKAYKGDELDEVPYTACCTQDCAAFFTNEQFSGAYCAFGDIGQIGELVTDADECNEAVRRRDMPREVGGKR